MTVRNAWKLFLSKTLPALMSRKADFVEGCTRLPELEERNDGAKLLPSPEYEAGLAGRMARSVKSTFFSDVFLSVEEITVSWRIPSEIACIAPVPLKAQEKNNEIMSTIPFMTSTCANIRNFRRTISRQKFDKKKKAKVLILIL